ncbi:MAG: hypothetical protein II301_07780 [Peptococcaceae bacterium]|nr:hypothetical protein [Peptococcaceae bacterium]
MQMAYDPDLILTEEYTEAEVQNYTGSFCGFVLLNGSYDLHALAQRLQQIYGIAIQSNHAEEMLDDANGIVHDLMLDVPGAMVTISFLNDPIPDGEVESAAMHAEWEGAKLAASKHRAHLMIAVLPDTMPAHEAGLLYCRILSVALEDAAVLAVYTSGTVLEPIQFCYNTEKSGNVLPLNNLIFVGTYERDGGMCGYTMGLDAFGKDELEILDCKESPELIHRVLYMCADKMIHENKSAAWYITVDVDGTQWEGRRKDGVMVEGHSLHLQPIKTK